MGKLLSRLLRVSDVSVRKKWENISCLLRVSVVKCEEKMGKLLSRLLRVSDVRVREKWENFFLVC